MSPEVRIENKLNINELSVSVPDKTGSHPTEYGEVRVDMSLINPTVRNQEIIIGADFLIGRERSSTANGTRKVAIDGNGIGKQQLTDGRTLWVKMHNKPIRPPKSPRMRRYGAR